MPVSEFVDADIDDESIPMTYQDRETLDFNDDNLSDISDSRHTDYNDETSLLVDEEPDNGAVQSRDKSATQEPSKTRKTLLMLACLYQQFATMSLTVSLGVIYVELIDTFNVPRSEAAMVQSTYMGVSIGGGIIFSKIIYRYDVGKCVICSSVISTVCLIASSFAVNLEMIIVFAGFVLGVSQSYNFLASYAVINMTFTKSRKAALGFLTIGQAVAMLSVPFLAGALLDQYSWDGCFLVLSALLPLHGVLVGLLFYVSSSYFAKHDSQANNKDSKGVPMYKDVPFMLYLTAYVAFATPGAVGQWFSVDLAVMKGFTTKDGETLLSASGICSFIGRISGTFLLHTFSGLDPEILLGTFIIGWAFAHVWIIYAPSLRFMILAMVLRGFTVGHANALLPALQLELRGARLLPETVALCSFLAGSTQVLYGYFGGYTADVTGGYDLIFLIAAGSSVYSALCLVLVLCLRKRNANQHRYERINS